MPRITGTQGVAIRLSRITDENMVRKVGQALFAGGELIRAEAFHMISEGSVSGKGHIASLPGEAPNRDSGVLQAHIEAVQTGPLSAEVSSNAPYASALEFGTSKMAERPYMRPATQRKRKDVVAGVRASVSQAIKSAQS